ncbi:hypothetical protein SHIRM173S_10100 [Streptomyces hirsutus]
MAASRVAQGEVEADADGVAGLRIGDEPLGLDAGEQAQRLGVALEAAAVLGELVQRLFAVVAEGRVAQVVREAGGLHQVRVAAEGGTDSRPTCAHSREWVRRVRGLASRPGRPLRE